jgi:hypothetical protein
VGVTDCTRAIIPRQVIVDNGEFVGASRECGSEPGACIHTSNAAEHSITGKLDLEQLRVDRTVPEMQDSDGMLLLRHAADRGLQGLANRFDQLVVCSISMRMRRRCALPYTAIGGGLERLSLDEGQQIGIDQVSMGGSHTVR